MKTYLALFKPLEPYFFGSEKTFSYYDAKTQTQTAGSYYIKSERMPSQSTILGALRYLFLPVKKSNWDYSDAEQRQNEEAVGAKGFDPAEKRSFGNIKAISPVFLYGPKGVYVATPFDHQKGKKIYTPFADYKEVEALGGKRLFTKDYDAKQGVTSSFMALADGAIVPENELFASAVKNGINRDRDSRGFYKQEKKVLRDGFSFGVYLTLDEGFIPQGDILFLGQNKSAFSVSFQGKENSLREQMAPYLREGVVYCLGDVFTDHSVYEKSLFSVTKIKTYRVFGRQNRRVFKDATLHKLIAAGSVFIPKNKAEFLDFLQNENTEIIGYNHFVTR